MRDPRWRDYWLGIDASIDRTRDLIARLSACAQTMTRAEATSFGARLFEQVRLEASAADLVHAWAEGVA